MALVCQPCFVIFVLLSFAEKEKQQAAAAEAMKVAQESQMTAGSQKAARKKRK